MKKYLLTASLLLIFGFVAQVFADGDEVPAEVDPFGDAAKESVVEKTTVRTETREVCTTTYGGGTECETVEVPVEEITRETVTHEVVDTGIVENAILAIGLFVAGYLVMMLAKRYEVVK